MFRSSGGSMGRLHRLQPALWLVAIAFYGVGDLVTTVIGLRISGIIEAGPLVGPLIDQYGVMSLFVLKFLTIGVSYGVRQVIPTTHRTGIPLGLAVLGVAVTGWNTVVVSTALFF